MKMKIKGTKLLSRYRNEKKMTKNKEIIICQFRLFSVFRMIANSDHDNRIQSWDLQVVRMIFFPSTSTGFINLILLFE